MFIFLVFLKLSPESQRYECESMKLVIDLLK